MRGARPLRAFAHVSLGRQRSPKHENGPFLVPYLRAANVKDGQLDLSDVKVMNFTPNEQQFFHLRPGDVLVTEGSGSLRTVGASAVWSGEIDGVVCFQNTLLRLRPRSETTDPRFLAWWARHAFVAGLFRSVATGANIYHVSAERVRSLPVSFPDLAAQQAIVDFLDVETARIDELIVKKRRLIGILYEWEQAQLVQHVGDWRETATVTLRQAGTKVVTGPFGTQLSAAEYVRGGVPVINPTHIIEGRLQPEEHVTVPSSVVDRLRRHRLHVGDIVMGRKGDVGRAALIAVEQEVGVSGLGAPFQLLPSAA